MASLERRNGEFSVGAKEIMKVRVTILMIDPVYYAQGPALAIIIFSINSDRCSIRVARNIPLPSSQCALIAVSNTIVN